MERTYKKDKRCKIVCCNCGTVYYPTKEDFIYMIKNREATMQGSPRMAVVTNCHYCNKIE